MYDHTRPPHIPVTDIYRLLNFVRAACQNCGGGILSRQSPRATSSTTATEEEGCLNVKGGHRGGEGWKPEGRAPPSRDSNWPKLGVSVLTCGHGNSSIIGGISGHGDSVGQRKQHYPDVSETNGCGEGGRKQNDLKTDMTEPTWGRL